MRVHLSFNCLLAIYRNCFIIKFIQTDTQIQINDMMMVVMMMVMVMVMIAYNIHHGQHYIIQPRFVRFTGEQLGKS